ncbi:hypothetical protein K8R47_02375 [archaeon]|nr:hypothetical protein [archaeon]
MYPIYHFISCIILAIILYPLLGLLSLFVFIFGYLIDVDHYIEYIIKKKSLSFKKAYKYYKYERHPKEISLNIFHTIEFTVLFLIFVILFPNPINLILGIGLITHLIMDIIWRILNKHIKRDFSLIKHLLRN